MRVITLLTVTVALTAGLGAQQDDDFHMTVMDAFTITGRGVVMTGLVEGGPVRVNDVVCLRPAEGESRELTVEAIEMFREELEVGNPGDAVGLLFKGIERTDVKRGDTLTAHCG